MSQYGAEGYALHGYSYARILAHYFPGTRLAHVSEQTRVRVLVAHAEAAVSPRCSLLHLCRRRPGGFRVRSS